MIEELGTEPPVTIVTGFKQQTYTLQITLGYVTFSHGGLMLLAMEQWGANPPALWRRFWVTKQGAVRAAKRLRDDAAQYLDMVSTKWRPSEDLSFDDFIEHIRLHVEGGMH